MTTEQIGSRFSMLGAQDSGYDPYAIYDETRTVVLSGEFDDRNVGQQPFTTVNYPNVVEIQACGFNDQKSLQAISCENCLSLIGGANFYGCLKLSTVYMPKLQTAQGGQQFRGCRSLTAIDFPELSSATGNYIATSCYSLAFINLPKLSSRLSGSTVFGYCSSLTSVNLDSCLLVTATSAFVNCSALSTLSMPALKTIRGSGIFGNCENLRWISMPQATLTLSTNMFKSCVHMQHLVLAKLSAGNATALSDLGLSNELSTDADGNSYACIVETQGQTLANHKIGTTSTKFPYGAPTTTKFVCSNGYAVYKNGAWTVVTS